MEGDAKDNLEMSLLFLPAADTGRPANYSFRHRQSYDAGNLSFYVRLQPVSIWPLPNAPTRLSSR